MRGEATGLGKAAKRRLRLLDLAKRYEAAGDAETAAGYLTLASEIMERLRNNSACIRCGRKLNTPGAEYGSECSVAALAAATESLVNDTDRHAD